MILEALQKGVSIGFGIVGASLILVGAFCLTLIITALLRSGSKDRNE